MDEIMNDNTDQESLVAGENTVVCQISGETKKLTDKEKTLQDVIRTLSSEYWFDPQDMERDYTISGVLEGKV